MDDADQVKFDRLFETICNERAHLPRFGDARSRHEAFKALCGRYKITASIVIIVVVY